jgi:hypothetical protein
MFPWEPRHPLPPSTRVTHTTSNHPVPSTRGHQGSTDSSPTWRMAGGCNGRTGLVPPRAQRLRPRSRTRRFPRVLRCCERAAGYLQIPGLPSCNICIGADGARSCTAFGCTSDTCVYIVLYRISPISIDCHESRRDQIHLSSWSDLSELSPQSQEHSPILLSCTLFTLLPLSHLLIIKMGAAQSSQTGQEHVVSAPEPSTSVSVSCERTKCQWPLLVPPY